MCMPAWNGRTKLPLYPYIQNPKAGSISSHSPNSSRPSATINLASAPRHRGPPRVGLTTSTAAGPAPSTLAHRLASALRRRRPLAARRQLAPHHRRPLPNAPRRSRHSPPLKPGQRVSMPGGPVARRRRRLVSPRSRVPPAALHSSITMVSTFVLP